ncbi:MAG: hypothetical protein E6I79_11550, partial [Chloroflexi bacterium]
MSRLTLMLLREPEVRYDGQLLTFPTRKALALLIYLAMEGGMHSREKLTALFWPESDMAHGRAVLRSTLGYLRSALREGTPTDSDNTPAQTSHLIVERDSLGFDFASDCELDFAVLQTAWNLAQASARFTASSMTRDKSHRHLLTQLERAVNLYRSDFLEGFFLRDAPGFDEWVSFQRATWNRRIRLVFDQLSQLQAEGGESRSAIETTTRWLTFDLLNEDAYRRLMQLYY